MLFIFILSKIQRVLKNRRVFEKGIQKNMCNRPIKMEKSYSTDSSTSNEFDCSSCYAPNRSCKLKFEPSSIENIILMISDKLDMRVIMDNERLAGAAILTAGFAFAGGILGKYYGGKLGAAVGGTVGGAIGVGVAVVSMRDVWDEVKHKLSELYEIVFDYLAGLGVDDYKHAASLLAKNGLDIGPLSMVMTELIGDTIGKKILSNLTGF